MCSLPGRLAFTERRLPLIRPWEHGGAPGTTGPRRTPMREAYQSDPRHIVDDLVDMSEMVGTALEDATTALLEGDLALAERVVTADPHLDSRQLELDAKTVE